MTPTFGPQPTSTHFEAIVVGCGPVGATAAIQLANAGFSVAVVEEHPRPYPYPRAVMLDAYSCAILAELLGDDYQRISMNRTPGAGYYLDKTNLDRPFASTGLNLGDHRNWFVQPQLEAILREVIERHHNITTYFGATARKLYADDTSTLTVEHLHSGETTELTGDYLLGCDGGNSFVRKQMGGSLIGLGDTVLFLVVDALAPPDKLAGKPGHAYQVVDRERPTTFLPMAVDNHCRWEFRINPDDDILELQSPEKIRELLEPWVDLDHLELLRHTVYKFNSLIASEWRKRNVFVCGDAAHQTSPFLGQGLNMGIRNTRNLCQKIELVAAGDARSELLDRYQAECFDATKATIEEALRMGKLLFNTSTPANLARSFVGNVIRRGKPIDITGQLAPEAQMLEAGRSVPSSVRKVLPQVEVRLEDGTDTMLALVDHTTCKILATEQDGLDMLKPLDEVPVTIRPQIYSVVDGFDGGQAGVPLILTDVEQRKALMGDAGYLVLGENSVVIGRYDIGQEAELIADYRQVFELVG
ncbi:MAG: FAD-dependent monooxygenase [Acidimicrobiales bacterium]